MGLAAKNAKSAKKAWPMVRLGDVCKFQRGLTYKKSDEVAQSENIVLRSNNIDLEQGVLDLRELKCIREDLFVPDDKKVIPGSILMCMANGSKSHLGKVALVQDDLGYAFGGFMGLLVPEGIDSSYLYLALRSAPFKECIRKLQDGANINNLKFSDFCDFPIPLPPLPVQREIVARLEKELGDADALAAKFKEIAENVDAEFKAELDETFKNVEGEKVRLGDVCEIKNGYTPKASELREAGDVPYFRISAMNFPGNERQMQCPTAWLVGVHRCFRSGSVVFPKNGGAVYTGKVRLLIRDSIVDLNTGVCSPIIDIDCDYLYYWITAYDIRSAIVEGTIPFVDFVKLNDANFMLPQLTIQHDIVKRLDAAKKRCEKLKAAAERGLRAAEDLRKAILAEAFEQ